MEAIMLTVDRLVDALNGEDPGGARMYMAQLRDKEAQTLLQSFQEVLVGNLSPSPSSTNSLFGGGRGSGGLSFNRSSSAPSAYPVPPSEFLKVLLEGNVTRLRALHAVLQAMGRGDLQGRAASLCLSELRMCLAACSAPPGGSSSSRNGYTVDNLLIPNGHNGVPSVFEYRDSVFDRAVGDNINHAASTPRLPTRLPRLRLRQLRELADVCLSFIVGPASAATSGKRSRATSDADNSAERNNRRLVMLDALPAVLGACCAAAACEESEYEHSSESEDDDTGEGIAPCGASPELDSGLTGNKRKGKGKTPANEDSCTGSGGGGGDRGDDRNDWKEQRTPHTDSGSLLGTGAGRRPRCVEDMLPERAAEVMVEVTSALLDRPWAPQLALPLLRMFEEVSDLVEALEEYYTDCDEGGGGGGGGGGAVTALGASAVGRGAGMGVWARVRSRLMECVWMGGLDGTDFTGVVQQVCILCEADIRRNWEKENGRPNHSLRHDKNGARPQSNAAPHAAATFTSAKEHRNCDIDGLGGPSWDRRQATTQGASIPNGGDWLSCLRRLYAAVPPDSLSTVELVLEQTLHQMPDVAESLLDDIQRRTGGDSAAAGAAVGVRRRSNRGIDPKNDGAPWTVGETPQKSALERGPSRKRSGYGHGVGSKNADSKSGTGSATEHLITHDLGLLLLLLREAAPLRACSLPLLPNDADRGRRAEDGVQLLLLSVAHRGFEGRWHMDHLALRRSPGGGGGGRVCTASKSGCRELGDPWSPLVIREGRVGAAASVRAVVKGVLCNETGSGARGGGSAAGGGQYSGGGYEHELESSSVASERASQLFELALRWLEEGDEGRSGSGGGGCILGVEELAAETISVVFDVVPGARPRLLRSLLSGVLDGSQGGVACARGYLSAWETLMAQEGRVQCRQLAPHSQVVSDVLGRLTLLPQDRAQRVVESMIPLADACRSHASALISLCRKCAAQGGTKGRRLALHAVTCILVWNVRRAIAGGAKDGCLNQEGVQEDLIGMFRRAMEGGLETAARAEALHLLTSRLFARPSSTASPYVSLVGVAAVGAMPEARREHGPPLEQPAAAAATMGVDVTVLGGLRHLLADRLYRFLVHKDEIIVGGGGGGDNSPAPFDGSHCGRPGTPSGRYGRSSYGVGDGADVDRGKGKGKKLSRVLIAGRYQFAPLRLLEGRRPSTGPTGSEGGGRGSSTGLRYGGSGNGISKSAHGYGGAGWEAVVPRDAIGQLLKCCWALVPLSTGVERGGSKWPSEAAARAAAGGAILAPGDAATGKQAEAEVVARAVLGLGPSWLEGDRGAPGRAGKPTRGFVGAIGAGTLEGEALLAVVEFLASGGVMETVRVIPSWPKQASVRRDDGDVFESDGDSCRAAHPSQCHPGLVGPLPALAIVVTVAEAMVDCLLNTVVFHPFMSSRLLPPTHQYSTPPRLHTDAARDQNRRNGAVSRVRGDTAVKCNGRYQQQQPLLIFWAAADTFTLLAAAARVTEGLGGASGGMKQSKFRPHEGLSAVIASLTGQTQGLSHRGSSFSNFEDGEEGGDGARGLGERGVGAAGGDRGGRGGAHGSEAPCPLFSTYSAFVFVKEFLDWVACVRERVGEGCSAREEVRTAVESIGEGWDGGVGVWLGLTHSVRTLAQVLESATKNSSQTAAQAEMSWHGGGGGGDDIPVEGQATRCEYPSCESAALAIFELRRVVGSPSAAARVHGGSAAMPSAAGVPWMPKSWSTAPSGARDEPTQNGSSKFDQSDPFYSLRPPPGAMVTGFLKRMSERWKVHLDWGLPGLTPPTRASPRLEHSNRRRRGFYDDSEDGAAGRVGGYLPEGLREEAGDLFYTLRGELLRAERLALSVLLHGSSSTHTSKLWVVRAALATSAFRTTDDARKSAQGGLGRQNSTVTGSLPARFEKCLDDRSGGKAPLADDSGGRPGGGRGGEEPEAGSGPARRAVTVNVSPNVTVNVRWPLRSRVQGSVTKDGRCAGRRRSTVAEEGMLKTLEGRRRESVERCGGISSSDGGGGLATARGGAQDSCGSRRDKEGEEEEVGEGLGTLCRYAALELREGLENGLSVKLTQAYLDLVELFGNAALEHLRRTKRSDITPHSTSPHPTVNAKLQESRVAAASASGYDHPTNGETKLGVRQESEERVDDAGEVLFSVLTCHCVNQVSLFQRLVRGAVQFEGVGVRRRHRRCRRHQERCSRLLVHCVRWMRRRQGGGGVDGGGGYITEVDGKESGEEAAVGAGRDASGACGSGEDDTDAGRKSTGTVDSTDGHDDSDSGTYNSQPEAVIIATPRECYAALTRVLAEHEAALMSSLGSFGGSGAGRGAVGFLLGGGAFSPMGVGAEVGEVLAVVAGGLRQFFVTSTTGVSATTTAVRVRNKGETGTTADSEGGDVAAEVSNLDAASTRREADELSTNVNTKDKTLAAAASSTRGQSVAVVSILPETMKLRLMQLLERVYLTGRAVSLIAYGALMKPPPTAVLRTDDRPPETRVKPEAFPCPVSCVLSPSTLSCAPPPATPSPVVVSVPPSSKRRRPNQEDSITKPGDQAAGVGRPAKLQVVARKVSTRYSARNSNRECSVRGVASPALATTEFYAVPVLPSAKSEARGDEAEKSESKAGVQVPGRVIEVEGKLSGGGGEAKSMLTSVAGLLAHGKREEARREEGEREMPEAARRLLEVVSPAAVAASGHCLELMSAARGWAEAERAQTRRAGDDPCRKKASTLLFKIDRCELEMSKAARMARQYLDNFHDDSDKLDRHCGSNQAETFSGFTQSRGGSDAPKVGGAGGRWTGSSSAKASGRSGMKGNNSRLGANRRDKIGNDGDDSRMGWGGGTGKVANNGRNEKLERALRTLVAGANTLAARRRESAAAGDRGNSRKTGSHKRKGRNSSSGGVGSPSRRKNDGLRGRQRRTTDERCQEDGSSGDEGRDREDGDENDSASLDDEQETGQGEGRRAGRGFRSGLASGKQGRRRSRGVTRVRSRNTVIDGWLEETREGETNGADAFVDLEDFIVG